MLDKKDRTIVVVIEDDEYNVMNVDNDEKKAKGPLQVEWIMNSTCSFHIYQRRNSSMQLRKRNEIK